MALPGDLGPWGRSSSPSTAGPRPSPHRGQREEAGRPRKLGPDAGAAVREDPVQDRRSWSGRQQDDEGHQGVGRERPRPQPRTPHVSLG